MIDIFPDQTRFSHPELQTHSDPGTLPLLGFSRDDLGLDPGFEPERKRCLDVVARNEVAAGIIVPRQIISRPFAPPKKDARFTLDDGIVLL